MARSKEVDAWFARYENPMKPVVERVRALVLGADPRIEECIKWQAPTFTSRGKLASFFPKSKQHASLMFHTGAHIPGEHPRLVGSGDTSRVLKVASVEEANAARRDIERLVKAWCDWRESADGRPAKSTRQARTRKRGTPTVAKNAPVRKSKRKNR
jgi:hypothetical protein